MRWMKSWAKIARPVSRRTARLLRAAKFVSVLVLLAGTVLPQDAAQPKTQDTSQATTLRSQSNVVLLPTLVKDLQGGIVYGLQAQDFIVEDDSVEQAARLDVAPAGQPISLVVALQRGRR